MQEHLKKVADSYDRGIEWGRKGIDSYSNLPMEIITHPDYDIFIKMQNESELSDSGREAIYEYLSPDEQMRFVDLGCCLNLMFRGYDKWKSAYFGVDISPKTIELLEEYTKKKNIDTGALYCGSIHDTPFEDSYFDIGSCIGSLEYFEKSFVEECIKEFYRIMKPGGKFVLDIPNVGTAEFEITSLIEKSLGREDRFDLTVAEFDALIDDYFEIKEKQIVGPMIQYFLIARNILKIV